MPATWLYVPAPRIPDRLAKATLASEGVIIDLEDATHPVQRPEARKLLSGLLDGLPEGANPAITLAVRVNHVASTDFGLDIAAVGPLLAAGVISEIHLPKVESADDVAAALALTEQYADGVPHLGCLIESAKGLRFAHEIAEAAGVTGISLGEADLRADLGLPRGERADDGLLLARLTVVQACRAAGLPAPRGSVFANIKDLDGLRASCADLRRLGFHGRSVIHPGQVAPVVEAFAPTDEELDWARSVAERAEGMLVEGTASVALPDGSFIDPAIVRQAHDLIARAAA
jgi:citrate lyase subunit beta / citryl-CoA lyase